MIIYTYKLTFFALFCSNLNAIWAVTGFAE